MKVPVQVTFRNMDPSEYVEQNIHEKIAKLETLSDHLTSCRVAVEALHRSHVKGKLYHVRIDLVLPGKELVVGHEGHDKHAHEDVYVAVRDAFDAMTRMLKKKLDKWRPTGVKAHMPPDHGRVTRLFLEEGYGFLETPDGMDVYFHENAVVKSDWQKLGIGSEVRFVLADGEGVAGPQASTVHAIGKHHIVS